MTKTKISAGIGLSLALLAFILSLIALNVRHFVDVHLVRNPNEASSANRLGGVGVFQSEFDSTIGGSVADDIASERIPPLTIEEPTTDFRLLFPSQTNFAAQVIPISSSSLITLDEAFGGLIKPTVEEELKAVNNLGFNGCQNYASEIDLAIGEFFNQVQASMLPTIFSAFTAQTLESLEKNIIDVINSVIDSNGLLEVSREVATKTFEEFPTLELPPSVCDGFIINNSTKLHTLGRTCISEIFTEASNRAVELPDKLNSFILDLISDEKLCSADLTVDDCLLFNSDKFTLVDTALDEQVFFLNNTSPQICESISCGDQTKLDFLETVLVPSFNNFVEFNSAVEALSAYIEIFENGGISASSTFADGFADLVPSSTEFSVVRGGNQRFEACVLLQGLGFDCSTLADYFSSLPLFLQSDEQNQLADAFNEVASLYLEFFSVSLILPLSAAPPAFKVTLLSGAYNTGLSPTDLVGDIVAICEDDEVDREKISTSQDLCIASAFFQGLAMVCISAGLVVPERVNVLVSTPFGILFTILGSILIFSALGVVQSAPVYQNVGDEGDGTLGIFFIQGYAPTLGAVSGIFLLFSCIAYVVSLCLVWREKKKEVSKQASIVDVEVSPTL